MAGMMLKQKYISVIGLFLALAAFGQGKAKGFSWQQFIAAVAFSISGCLLNCNLETLALNLKL